MNYQLIAFDMDDTLLDSNRLISPENRVALQTLIRKGIKIVLCSGRPTASLLSIARDIFPDGAGEYIISFNGAAIVSVESGLELQSTPVPLEAGLSILTAARSRGHLLQAYRNKRFYTEHDCARARAYSEAVGMPFEVVPDLARVIRDGSLKLLMNAPHEELLHTKQSLQDRADRGEFHMVFSKPDYLEFLHPEVNKGTGLTQLCSSLGVDITQTIAVGDSSNDLEMLQQAGLGIAVANARDDLKAAADIILTSNHNQSIVVEILQHVQP